VRDGVRTGERLWLLYRQLGLEVADGWKIWAEVLAQDASRLGTATVVRDSDDAAWLRLGPATVRWSGGTTLDDWLRISCMGGGPAPATSSAGMRRNCSRRRP
jgi:hypothetical protein